MRLLLSTKCGLELCVCVSRLVDMICSSVRCTLPEPDVSVMRKLVVFETMAQQQHTQSPLPQPPNPHSYKIYNFNVDRETKTEQISNKAKAKHCLECERWREGSCGGLNAYWFEQQCVLVCDIVYLGSNSPK